MFLDEWAIPFQVIPELVRLYERLSAEYADMTTLRHMLETVLIDTVAWLKLIIEAIGVAFIGVGAGIAIAIVLRALFSKQALDFARVRISLAHYLALALEFQLGADILATAVAPGWDAIGKLAAIAVIRTGLNFFLTREMAEQSTAIEPLRNS